jgi:hypothetical protein
MIRGSDGARGAIARRIARRAVSAARIGSAACALTALLCATAGAAQSPQSKDARDVAPIDLTGYWVSLVTEDWRFRMLVADPGETESVPLNDAGLKLAKAWTPERDRSDPDAACKAFGAPGLMRIPGRVHISWQDANTLQVQTDSGSQTREFHFTPAAAPEPAPQAPSWQGYSVASWQQLTPTRRVAGGTVTRQKEGYLQVVTTGLRPGYLRTNGIPYGSATQLTEYYDSFHEATGDDYLVVTAVVKDPEFLNEPFVTSSHFRRQPDARGWDPTPCRADVPR